MPPKQKRISEPLLQWFKNAPLGLRPVAMLLSASVLWNYASLNSKIIFQSA